MATCGRRCTTRPGRRVVERRAIVVTIGDRPPTSTETDSPVATPNYGYEKRQKELAKKRKKEDKLKRKADIKNGVGGDDTEADDAAPETGPATEGGDTASPPA